MVVAARSWRAEKRRRAWYSDAWQVRRGGRGAGRKRRRPRESGSATCKGGQVGSRVQGRGSGGSGAVRFGGARGGAEGAAVAPVGDRRPARAVMVCVASRVGLREVGDRGELGRAGRRGGSAEEGKLGLGRRSWVLFLSLFLFILFYSINSNRIQ